MDIPGLGRSRNVESVCACMLFVQQCAEDAIRLRIQTYLALPYKGTLKAGHLFTG